MCVCVCLCVVGFAVELRGMTLEKLVEHFEAEWPSPGGEQRRENRDLARPLTTQHAQGHHTGTTQPFSKDMGVINHKYIISYTHHQHNHTHVPKCSLLAAVRLTVIVLSKSKKKYLF